MSPRSLPTPDRLVLIQFEGPPQPEWLQELSHDKVTIFHYVPEHAYLARLPALATGTVHGRPFVRAVVPYLPSMRVDPDLWNRTAEGTVRLRLQAAPDMDPDVLARTVNTAAPGAVTRDSGHHSRAILLDVEVEGSDLSTLLPALATLPGLFWIEEVLPIRPHNNLMKGILQSGVTPMRPLFDRGLTGAGQILGQSDSGVDVDHCFFLDPSVPVVFEQVDPNNPAATPATSATHRKLVAYQFHPGSDGVDGSGHGTHVAGTALGDDLANLSSGTDPGLDLFDGMAPGARLVFQDVDATGGFLDVPANLYGYFQSAYNAGARIHTNSWGAATSSYTSDSSQVDDFTWDNPDILFLFSAGNNGPNAQTIEAPASAKNVLAVGMVETPAGGDSNNLDSGSSNGPTSDGRLKPEISNVGGFPIRSASAGTACGIEDNGGTSMATPGVAAGVALLRQYLTDGFYPHGYAGSGSSLTPSAALLKAMVINSAVNITGSNVDGDIPDNSQGWGRVLLDNVAFFPGDAARLEILNDDDLTSNTDGFAVGAGTTDSYQIFNCRPDVPIKVTLVWTEPPVAATSGQAWVNNLDLEVETPGSVIYRGNVFSNGVSATGGTADDRNNVEQVLLPGVGLASGTYAIRVIPQNVAVGPQPYALLVTGDVSSVAVPQLGVTNTSYSAGCDSDTFLDENETLDITYTIENQGCGDAGALNLTLANSSAEPLTIQPSSVPVSGIDAGDSTTVVFQLSLGDTGGVCGGESPLLLTIQDSGGARWENTQKQGLRLDPATGSRVELDDVESGDQSSAKDAEWQINSCMTFSGSNAWHVGQSDCSGIPRDAQAYSLEFSFALAQGEDLDTASFVHAFDGYSNSNLADSVHFEIDHDLDGTYDSVASWSDGAAPTSMTAAGPFELSAFNSGRDSSVMFRFRFQSAANWVGGPNNAPGWNVDDFQVDIDIFGACSTVPGNVDNTLAVSLSRTDALLSWDSASNASGYRVRRATEPEFLSPDEFSTTSTSFMDTDIPAEIFFYDVLAVSGCVASAN